MSHTATKQPTKTGVKPWGDSLTEDEIDFFKSVPAYEPGKPYLWTLSHGWAIIGFYIQHISGLFIQVAHANHFRNAGVDYGTLGQEGPGPNCEWRYEGVDLINLAHVLKVSHYYGEVPRGRVLR